MVYYAHQEVIDGLVGAQLHRRQCLDRVLKAAVGRSDASAVQSVGHEGQPHPGIGPEIPVLVIVVLAVHVLLRKREGRFYRPEHARSIDADDFASHHGCEIVPQIVHLLLVFCVGFISRYAFELAVFIYSVLGIVEMDYLVKSRAPVCAAAPAYPEGDYAHQTRRDSAARDEVVVLEVVVPDRFFSVDDP